VLEQEAGEVIVIIVVERSMGPRKRRTHLYAYSAACSDRRRASSMSNAWRSGVHLSGVGGVLKQRGSEVVVVVVVGRPRSSVRAISAACSSREGKLHHPRRPLGVDAECTNDYGGGGGAHGQDVRLARRAGSGQEAGRGREAGTRNLLTKLKKDLVEELMPVLRIWSFEPYHY
jgi:hypothetical protein